MLKIVKLLKNLLILVPITYLFSPLTKFFTFLHYFNQFLSWKSRNGSVAIFNDYFSPFRNYDKRFQLYDFVVKHYGLNEKKINYMEFGVAGAFSFKWWLQNNLHQESDFYGFDTFEGLPESWGGFFAKGDMSYALPDVTDKRAKFLKGLFQDTLHPFIKQNEQLLLSDTQKVIHLDADLYSATIFTLSQIYPYLRKGDIIMFDEFNVPLHEFKAYQEFVGNFYVKLKLVAAVNNYYQVAFEVG